MSQDSLKPVPMEAVLNRLTQRIAALELENAVLQEMLAQQHDQAVPPLETDTGV